MLPFFSTGWTFEPNYFRKYATDLRKFLPIGSITGVDDCCEIGLWSLKGRCHDNQFLFIQSTQFFRHSDQCVINVVYSATTRSTVVGIIQYSRSSVDDFCWPHQYTGERIFPPGTNIPPGHFSDTRVPLDTTKSTSTGLDAGVQINWTINNN